MIGQLLQNIKPTTNILKTDNKMSPLTTKYYSVECECCQKTLISVDRDHTQSLFNDHISKNEEHLEIVKNSEHSEHNKGDITELKLIDLMNLSNQNYYLLNLCQESSSLESQNGGVIHKTNHKLKLVQKFHGDGEVDGVWNCYRGSNRALIPKQKSLVLFLDCEGSLEEILSLVLILLSFGYPFPDDQNGKPIVILCNSLRSRLNPNGLIERNDQEFKIDDITLKLDINKRNPSDIKFDFEWRIGDGEYKKVTNPKYEPQKVRSSCFILK